MQQSKGNNNLDAVYHGSCYRSSKHYYKIK